MFQSALKYGPSILNYGTKAAYLASQLGRAFSFLKPSTAYSGGYGKSYGSGPYVKRRMAYYPTRAMYGSSRAHGPLPYRSTGSFGHYPAISLQRTGGNLGWMEPKKWIDIDDVTNGGWITPLWNFLDATIPTTWQMANCPILITQGTSPNQRIGNQVIIKEIILRGCLALPSATGVNNMKDTVDLAFIQDTQCNGTQVTSTDIFYRDVRDSFLNLNNNNRFRVLKRLTLHFNVDAIANTTGANTYQSTPIRQVVDISVRCNIPVTFSSTTGNLAERRSNNIYICQCSQEGRLQWVTGGYETPKLRTRYIDLMR